MSREGEREEKLCYLGTQCEVKGNGCHGEGELMGSTEGKVKRVGKRKETEKELFSCQVIC